MIAPELPAAWRSRADELERYAAPAAEAFRMAAGELDAALREAAEAPLTLNEATAEGGYSNRRLRELIASGALVNVGRKGAPRIRRADLPRKPRSNDGFDAGAAARSILGGPA